MSGCFAALGQVWLYNLYIEIRLTHSSLLLFLQQTAVAGGVRGPDKVALVLIPLEARRFSPGF